MSQPTSTTNPYMTLAITSILGGGQPIDMLPSMRKPFAVGMAFITPEIAAKIQRSKMDVAQRDVYPAKKAEYLKAMEDGRWSDDFQVSFVVLKDGQQDEWCVGNGNHRLSALADAKIPGLDAQVTIHLVDTEQELQAIVNGFDNGKPRSNADKLRIGGFGKVPDVGLFGGVLGAAKYGFKFAKSSMDHDEIIRAAGYWEPAYRAYMKVIGGEVPELPTLAPHMQDAMYAKLRTNVVASVGMVTFNNSDPATLEEAKKFWRGLRTMDAQNDARLQLYIKAASTLFDSINKAKVGGKNPLRNEAGRAQLFRQMCALWNDWVSGAEKPRPMTSVNSDDVAKVLFTGLDGSTDKSWSAHLDVWVPI